MRILYLVLILAFASSVSAQSFEELRDNHDRPMYEDNTNIMLFLRYTNVSDPYVDPIKGVTANFSLHKVKGWKGGANWHYENPTLGDFVYVLSHWKKSQASKVDKSFGSGFFGWHQFYFNAVVTKRFIFAPGFSLGDYIFGINQTGLQTTPSTLEPNGYYFTIGPAAKVAYVISNNWWLEGFVYNDIGFKAGKPGGNYQHIDGYKKPFFFSVGANLHSTSRFFAGFRMVKLNDRGENEIKSTRLDISAGYMFK